MRYLYFLFLLQLSIVAKGQSYYKGLPEKKATINYPDHTATTQLIPVKGMVTIQSDKMYHWYSSNKISITQGGYSGQLLNGIYTDVYLNKNLKEQGRFDAGLKSGEWISWNPDGRLREKLTWNDGLIRGKFQRYDEHGILKEKGRYRKGKLSGKKITFIGDSSAVSYYRDGTVYSPKKRKLVPSFLKKLVSRKKSKPADK